VFDRHARRRNTDAANFASRLYRDRRHSGHLLGQRLRELELEPPVEHRRTGLLIDDQHDLAAAR
jgi:hypothetical protein